jgi:excinuclease ABC subunit C
MEFVTTHTEAEALLLESNLIKRYVPRYNILLRDDKSFPCILVTRDHPFPQVMKHRGARTRKGEYFGPFAATWAVNQTLTFLERAFLLRSCSDSVFSNRTRPCLLHQIKRCSAPCAGRISQEDYSALVDQAHSFLTGHSSAIQRDLAKAMEASSEAQEYEAAAQYRDRIRALANVQVHQSINLDGIEEADVIACHKQGGQSCIQVFFFRAGCNYGNRAYYPSHGADDDCPQILEAFIGQFYDNKQPPKLILVSEELPSQELLTEALSVKAGQKVTFLKPERGSKTALIKHALDNAREALSRRIASSASQRRLLDELQRLLDLEAPPERIEVFDNSHIQGSEAVGAMIVAGPEGLMKNAYRKFTIRGLKPKIDPAATLPTEGVAPETAPAPVEMSPGDDYAMMREVLTRRYSRALKEDPDRSKGQWPDLILIDGGLGQLGIAREVFADLGIDDICVAAIAKGPDRDAGREKIFLPDREPIQLDPKSPVLHFLQRLRDEAHRFVIGAHRDKRSKGLERSALDSIPGIGSKRKKALLHRFGSAKGVERAAAADLAMVEGISKATAKKIYDWFHPEG